jgi:hypothetical protein
MLVPETFALLSDYISNTNILCVEAYFYPFKRMGVDACQEVRAYRDFRLQYIHTRWDIRLQYSVKTK